ncbi:hypothetical protein [Actinoplanes sp. M2I2]|uniref:hypothetical protein n=1 Tax=Actinoplanes sp. M2I2 TaxID=1734444 RepID=UPI0020201E92|nr:hypothetical protein [Actinoplanes sp. M2I2]
MAVEELLTALDPLPYHQRMRHVAAWARTAPDRAEVCAELLARGDHGRRLALVAAMVAQDAAGIVAASSDPQILLRARVFDRRITELSARDRRRAYRTLRRLDDTATADALIGEVREHFGDEEAAALLPACGPSVVRAALPDLEFAANLEVVARRHPDLLLARAGERLAAAPIENRWDVWEQVGAAVLSCDPGRALDLVERFPVNNRLPGDLRAYGRLAAADPGRVARLLAPVETGPLPPAVVRRLAALPNEALVPLARTHLRALLDALAPSRRTDLYDRASTGRVPSPAILELLPVATRIREAARAAELVSPSVRGKYRAYLAWTDVSAALAPQLRSGDAAERERAWARLVTAARLSRDPHAVAEVIDRLDQLRNEQDPVRAAALSALSGVARLLTASAAAPLTRVTTAAVEARDSSATTAAELARLALGTLRFHVDVPALREWALFTIDRVGTAAPVPHLASFDGVPPAIVWDRLRPWVSASLAQGRPEPLLAVARALGRGAYDRPELQDLLGSAIGSRLGDQAVRLWLADRRQRSRRVAQVLDSDLTAVTLPIVWETISSRRTDLLDKVFAGPMRGRRLGPGERWIPRTPRHVDRWLPRQQEAFVELLATVAGDPAEGVWTRARVLRTAAVVPGAGRELVLRHRDDPAVPIAEAALGALPWTDRPGEALSILLEYAGSDRARVALYAAGRAAAHTEPGRLPALLGGVLAGPAKVTSRKEAARLLARYAPAEVMTTLLEVFRNPDTPRDVRAAIVAGAGRRLDAYPSWTVLAAARDGSREERRAVLATAPARISARHRPRYAALIADAGRSPDPVVRRAAFAALPAWLPWAPAGDLVTARFTDLGEELGPAEVAGLLPALAPTGLTAVLSDLIGRDAEPVRRRLDVLARGTAAWSRDAPAATGRSALIASARWLAARPGRRPVAAALLLGLGRLDNLDELADLCAGRPVLAVRTADRIRDRLIELPAFEDRAAIGRLAARGDLAGGLFAVALLTDTRVRWTDPWRDLLGSLRDHHEPEVRDEAWDVDSTHR